MLSLIFNVIIISVLLVMAFLIAQYHKQAKEECDKVRLIAMEASQAVKNIDTNAGGTGASTENSETLTAALAKHDAALQKAAEAIKRIAAGMQKVAAESQTARDKADEARDKANEAIEKAQQAIDEVRSAAEKAIAAAKDAAAEVAKESSKESARKVAQKPAPMRDEPQQDLFGDIPTAAPATEAAPAAASAVEDNTVILNEAKESPSRFIAKMTQSHPQFFAHIKERGPALTNRDLTLCLLIALGYDKETLCTTFALTPESFKAARYRLRTKMSLERRDNLDDILIGFLA